MSLGHDMQRRFFMVRLQLKEVVFLINNSWCVLYGDILYLEGVRSERRGLCFFGEMKPWNVLWRKMWIKELVSDLWLCSLKFIPSSVTHYPPPRPSSALRRNQYSRLFFWGSFDESQEAENCLSVLSQFYSNAALKWQDKVQFTKGSSVTLMGWFLNLSQVYSGRYDHFAWKTIWLIFFVSYFRIPLRKTKHSVIICAGYLHTNL